jgi:hypothetical protein
MVACILSSGAERLMLTTAGDTATDAGAYANSAHGICQRYPSLMRILYQDASFCVANKFDWRGRSTDMLLTLLS